MTYTTSPSLLLRIRNPENADAWVEFLDTYSPIVRRYCWQRGLQNSDVEDVTQDVMTTVATKIRQFEYDPGRGRFRAWLGTVTANRIKGLLAKNSKRNLQVAKAISENKSSDHYADPDSDWVDIFSQQIFRVACNRIQSVSTETAWTCFESTWIRDDTPKEVAKRLEIPVHAVYVNKSRVLKRLEKEVQCLADDLPFANGMNRDLQ